MWYWVPIGINGFEELFYLDIDSVSELSSSIVRYVRFFSKGLGIFLTLTFDFSSVIGTFGSLFLLSVSELIFSIIMPCENISFTFSPVGPRILSKLCLRPKNTRIEKNKNKKKDIILLFPLTAIHLCFIIFGRRPTYPIG